MGKIVMMKQPHRGAVIYAGNDKLWKVACHRDHADKSAKVIGYQKVNLKKADAIEKVLDKKHNRSVYTMVRVADGVEYKLYAPSHMHGHYQNAFWDEQLTKPAGVVKMEAKPLEKGGTLHRGDSHGMFKLNAYALQKAYPSSDVKSFGNVHDDHEVDPGKAMDKARKNTREHFMDQLRAFQGKYDFFAYCGHGDTNCLPSACISTGKGEGFDDFVKELERILLPASVIVLYACKAGISGGFAEKLSNRLPSMKIFAHTSARRGDNNPETVVFEKGQGVEFKKMLGDEGYSKWENRVLSSPELYLCYPWMSKEQLLEACA